MDELLREFLTETSESLDTVDIELVYFEQDPNNARILDNIFRLVHTIRGTCGFLGLVRLEALTYAAETLMGKFRDGMPVTGAAVTVILSTIDRIKEVLEELQKYQREPAGSDGELIGELEQMVIEAPTVARGEAPAAAASSESAPAALAPAAPATPASQTTGTLACRVLERPLRPDEVSLDELERAFRETAGPQPTPEKSAKSDTAKRAAVSSAAAEEEKSDAKIASQTLRVIAETLEHLMTMVSELVLTRNQLLEIARRHENSEFTVPLQRLSNMTAELQEGVMKTRLQPSDTPGVLGSAVIKGQATEIIDVGYYLPQAFEDRLIRTEKRMKEKARTILFVEDSAFFRNMLTPVLRSAGYAVTTVSDAHDALAVLKSGDQVDMIGTDIEMPGMSGYELAQAVRSDERTANLPIIALSALTSPDAIKRGRQVGFHDYVAKFDRPGLIAALKEQAALMGAA